VDSEGSKKGEIPFMSSFIPVFVFTFPSWQGE
jgi:hypothetical protein